MESMILYIYFIIIASICNIGRIQGIAKRRPTLLFTEHWLNDIDGDNIPGQAGVDYPVYSSVPEKTSFQCKNYNYAGYFADVEADCQAYHVCFPDGRNASFLCVNGTVFHQRYYVCDWWFHSNCSLATELYELNLYRKIPLPVLPPISRRPFPGPAPQPKVELPKQREAKTISDKLKTGRKEKNILKDNSLPPSGKTIKSSRNDDACVSGVFH